MADKMYTELQDMAKTHPPPTSYKSQKSASNASCVMFSSCFLSSSFNVFWSHLVW